jgi:hypothetical protein
LLRYYLGDPDSKRFLTRVKRWNFHVNVTCAGKWVRQICNVGLGDLPWVISSPQMFLNKIRLEDQPTAFRCLEIWHRDRVRNLDSVPTIGLKFDIAFYANQSFVKNHV